MSNNFRKTFNIRNGVQVDQDNFVVNSNGLVGIGTSIPREFLDVVGNAHVSGLTTTGTLFAGTATANNLTSTNANITGVITATSISVGGVTFSSIVGYSTEAWIIDYADGSSNPQSGISTTLKVGIGTTQANNKYSLLIGGDPVSGEGITLNGPDGNINSSGIMTATSFSGSGANLTSLNATNISSGTINNSYLPATISVTNVNATTFTGDLTGTATTATSLSGTPNIVVGIVTASNVISTSSSVGFATVTDTLHLDSAKIGIGTALPTVDLQIHKSSGSVLEVVSDTGDAKIGIGNSVGLGNSSALIRFNNKNLEFYNYDSGNIDSYIHDGTGAGTTGNFRWLYGQSNTDLMSLTWDGKLGINVSNPLHALHVSGGATFTSAAYFGSSVNVTGNVDVSGSFTCDTFNITGVLDADVYSIGISTFATLKSTTQLTAPKIGINSDNPTYGLDAQGETALFGYVGIGTTTPRSGADFGNAGGQVDRYMLPPIVNNTERAGLGTIEGAVIYNIEDHKLQVYTNSGWETITSS